MRLKELGTYSCYGNVRIVDLPKSVVATLNAALVKVSAKSEVVTHVSERRYGKPLTRAPRYFENSSKPM